LYKMVTGPVEAGREIHKDIKKEKEEKYTNK
jgi:hypothetical protein